MLLRVAAYCRVSTEREQQQNSLAAQKRFFGEYIAARGGWTFAGIYADEGESGTSARSRPEFLRLMAAALSGDVDLIVTKDVSRFARNTLDTLDYTRRLRRAGVGVVFISDGINTLEPDGEFRLSIMASVAQEESRKTSERVKWGQARAMESGCVFGNRSIYGYRLVGGRLEPDPDEAPVVRLIFEKCAKEGKGCYTVARELDELGIRPRYAGGWSQQSVLKILRNEKYAGDLLQKKYVTPDYLDHKKIRNPDPSTMILIKNHHEPLVPRRLFAAAQKALAGRKKSKNKQNS